MHRICWVVVPQELRHLLGLEGVVVVVVLVVVVEPVWKGVAVPVVLQSGPLTTTNPPPSHPQLIFPSNPNVQYFDCCRGLFQW